MNHVLHPAQSFAEGTPSASQAALAASPAACEAIDGDPIATSDLRRKGIRRGSASFRGWLFPTARNNGVRHRSTGTLAARKAAVVTTNRASPWSMSALTFAGLAQIEIGGWLYACYDATVPAQRPRCLRRLDTRGGPDLSNERKQPSHRRWQSTHRRWAPRWATSAGTPPDSISLQAYLPLHAD